MRGWSKKRGKDSDDDEEDEDEDEEDVGSSTRTLADLLEQCKYMLLTKAAGDAVNRAHRMVMEVMFSDKRPYEIVQAIECKQYAAPTEAEAKAWGRCGMGNTSSSYAYYAIFEVPGGGGGYM